MSASNSITGCNLTVEAPEANEHVAEAVKALAGAISANADAIGRVADALKGPNVNMEAMIKVCGDEK